MIKQSSGAIQIRDVLSEVQGKIIILGNEQSISHAQFLIGAAFDHFQEIYQKVEENKIAFPQPSLEEFQNDQFLPENENNPISSQVQSIDNDLDSNSSSKSQHEKNQKITYSEFILPNQISIKYQGIFDRCDQTSKKYKGQFIVPQYLVGFVLGKQKRKIDNIQKRQQILGIYYDSLQQLGDDGTHQEKKQKGGSSRGKKSRSTTLFTVFGVNKQCVKIAVQELYLIQQEIPLEVQICEYLLVNSKLAGFQQRSNVQKLSIDSNVNISQDKVKYQSLVMIGSPKSVKNCKAIVQMFLEMEYAKNKSLHRQSDQNQGKQVKSKDQLSIDDQPILKIQNLNGYDTKVSAINPSSRRSSGQYSEIDSTNDYDRYNKQGGFYNSYHGNYRGGGGSQMKIKRFYNNNNANNYGSKYQSRGGYDNRKFNGNGMYKGQGDRSTIIQGGTGKFKYVKKE